MMDRIIPYVHFDGNAAEAMELYSRVFQGQVLHSQTYGDSPMDIKPEFRNRIMHAVFQAGDDFELMVSDTPPDFTMRTGNNMSLSMNFKTVDEIERVFKGLSEGAHITMPLQDTFWGARFGMLTDKYGINWMFNHDYGIKKD